VPAYVVFHDSTLREMASRLPRTRSQMLEVTGVGPVKFERYGDAFLEALNDTGGEA
jgi:ATP-dependent DNA helicase RecQ